MAKQKSLSLKIENEGVYRELSIPFKSPDDANKALEEFLNELYTLRVKHRIRDMLFVIQVPLTYDDGEEGSPIVHGMLGDINRAEALAAYAMGRTGAERQERMANMVDTAIRAVKAAKSRE